MGSIEDNITMSNRPERELDIYNIIYPVYAVYLKMFLLLVFASLMVVSTSMVILAIL